MCQGFWLRGKITYPLSNADLEVISFHDWNVNVSDCLQSRFFIFIFPDASDDDASDAGDLPLPSFDLHGIDAGTFGLILDYIYTGECELNEQSVQALLSAANQLQLFRLKAGCAEFMMQRIGVPNCIGLFFFARLYQCPLLAAKAKEMICKHFTSLWQVRRASVTVSGCQYQLYERKLNLTNRRMRILILWPQLTLCGCFRTFSFILSLQQNLRFTCIFYWMLLFK